LERAGILYKIKNFKKLFGSIAEKNGFESAFMGWFKESQECITVLDLQKSNYGNYYLLNIKVYVQGVFGKSYTKSKDLVKKYTGNVFRGTPLEFKDCLNLEIDTTEEKRKLEIEEFFKAFLTPFADKSLSKRGLIELAAEGKIYLLPAIKKELGLDL